MKITRGVMRVECAEDDAFEFVAQVEALARGIAKQMQPAFLFVVKVDNWFGPKWLSFSTGANVFARGIQARSLQVPIFVPNRVIWERTFNAPRYQESAIRRPVHVNDVEDARARRVSDLPRGAALLWYSGGSKSNKRGSVMAYVAGGGLYKPWYAGWTEARGWRVEHALGIDAEELSNLIKAGRMLVDSERADV